MFRNKVYFSLRKQEQQKKNDLIISDHYEHFNFLFTKHYLFIYFLHALHYFSFHVSIFDNKKFKKNLP